MPVSFFYNNCRLVPDNVACDTYVVCPAFRDELHAMFEGFYDPEAFLRRLALLRVVGVVKRAAHDFE